MAEPGGIIMTDDRRALEGVPIALVDPNRLFREGLKRIFSEQGARILIDVDSIRDFRRLHANGGAGVRLVIFDPTDPGAEGDGSVAALVQEVAAPVVVLTGAFRMPSLMAMLQAGVAGYLLKTVSSAVLLEAIGLVLLGEKVFPSSLAPHLSEPGRPRPRAFRDPFGTSFTRQELAVLSALQEGKNNRQIAAALGISAATVRIYMKRLLRKLNVSNRTQAALWALSNDVASRVKNGPA